MSIDFKEIEANATKARRISDFIEAIKKADTFEVSCKDKNGMYLGSLQFGWTLTGGPGLEVKTALLEYLNTRLANHLGHVMSEASKVDSN